MTLGSFVKTKLKVDVTKEGCVSRIVGVDDDDEEPWPPSGQTHSLDPTQGTLFISSCAAVRVRGAVGNDHEHISRSAQQARRIGGLLRSCPDISQR